jgi:opacity protein-like surface antigen
LPPKNERLRSPAQIIRLTFPIVALVLIACGAISAAQSREESSYYGKANSFGVLGAYSWDSSHMLLGYAQNRMLVNIGVSYSRRLFHNHIVNWQYDGELLPVALESDPAQYTTETATYTTNPPVTFVTTITTEPIGACRPFSESVTFPPTQNSDGFTADVVSTCGRRWTIGEAISPVGMRWNFRPTHTIQPFVDGHGGYMYSTQEIPVIEAGSFNFTFDIGAGFELYRSKTRSIRAEYRYHHISNHDTAPENPGIDNGLLQVTYSFGFGRQ